ncbi:MAG: 30S ribosomal protein S18 [Acidimicrobiia bacterium]|nr:30S ribosomal protein S18 [Acidimicrobiia bacterium]
MAAKTSRRPRRKREERAGRRVTKKPCYFCIEKIAYVDYKDVALLRKYLSDRAKIRSSRVTGTCVQHQRAVARAIKNAREMALLPYLSR